MDGQRNLESQGKVWEFEISGCGKQTSENLFILFRREKMYFFMR